MNFKLCLGLAVLVGAFLVGGCDIGRAPKGMDEGDAKAAIDKMTPEQKIKAIASSPMMPADKEKRYAEIEAETGVKAADVLGQQQITPGTQTSAGAQ